MRNGNLRLLSAGITRNIHPEAENGAFREFVEQLQLAQLIALGHTVAVTCASARSWLWSAHVAVPLTGSSAVTTVLAWPQHSRSLAVARLVGTAARL